MPNTCNTGSAAPQAAHPRLVRDVDLAPMIGVSVGFLQRDRREAQRIPFLKVGDRCLYDVDAVFAALKMFQRGGPLCARGSRRAKVAA
jgi:hypothetical protein